MFLLRCLSLGACAAHNSAHAHPLPLAHHTSECLASLHPSLHLSLRQAATLRGHPLYRVTATEVLSDTRNGKWKAGDHRCVLLPCWLPPRGIQRQVEGGGPQVRWCAMSVGDVAMNADVSDVLPLPIEQSTNHPSPTAAVPQAAAVGHRPSQALLLPTHPPTPFPPSTNQPTNQLPHHDRRFLKLLQSGTDPAKHGGALYFSYGGDATLSQQRYEAAWAAPGAAEAGPWRRAAPAFAWNSTLAAPLLGALAVLVVLVVVWRHGRWRVAHVTGAPGRLLGSCLPTSTPTCQCRPTAVLSGAQPPPQ